MKISLKPLSRFRGPLLLAWYRSHGILPEDEGGGIYGTLVTSTDDARGGIDSQEIERKARTTFGLDL